VEVGNDEIQGGLRRFAKNARNREKSFVGRKAGERNQVSNKRRK